MKDWETLGGIRDAAETISAGSSSEDIYERTVNAVEEVPSVDACELLVEQGGTLQPRATSGIDPDDPTDGAVLGRDVAAQTHRTQEIRSIEDAADDPRIGRGREYRSILSVPLGTHGVLQVGAREPKAFGENARTVATLLGGHATRVLDGVRTDSQHSLSLRQAREFVEIADVMMIALDADGRITFANRRAREVLGYDEGDLVGRDWFETCVPVRARSEVRTVFERLMAGKTDPSDRYENSLVTKDGNERIIEWHNTVLRNDRGEITGTLSSGLDVTQRTEQERLLSEEHEKYSALVENSNDGICIIQDEEFAFVNERFAEFYETTPDRLVGESFLTDVDPECRDVVETRSETRLAGQDPPDQYEVEILDGERILEINAARIEYEGRPAGMGVARDITEQRERKRELDAARTRYQTLLRTAPDPIFVADAETGEIVEANRAAEALRGEPREEIVGRHQTDLHPDDDAALYRTLFEEHVQAGGTRRRFPDGSQIYVVTGSGEEIPVEVSFATVELDDGPVIYGIFRDISDQLEYERMLTGLNEATRELFGAKTSQDVGRCVVETVTDVFDLASAAFYWLDENDGVLRPIAHEPPSDAAALLDELPVLEPGESIAWRVFTDSDLAVFDDVRTDEDVHNPETPIRSEIVVPVGEWGVLLVGDTRTSAFDHRAADLVRILGAAAEASLERVAYEQDLARREQQLQERTRRLEQVEAINEQIREVMGAIVRSETRRQVEESVCAQLAETGPFDFAWIGETNPVNDRLDPRAKAGNEQGYLERVGLSLDDDTVPEPAVEAIQTGEPVVVSNTATNMATEPWRQEAVTRGLQSVMSVPLVYQGTSHSVLTIYATEQSEFSDMVEPVLVELGELVANAVASIDRKRALLSNQATELEFDIRDRSCFFLRFVREVGCTLDLDGIVSQSDESSLVFVRLQDGSPEQLVEEAERAPAIESAHVIEHGDDALVQFRFVEEFIASLLAEHGIVLQNISADSSACRVTVAVPPSFTLQRVVDIVTTLYPDSELLAKREQVTPVESTWSLTDRFLDELTPRQREVVEVAYRSGYFESPRPTSSDELADEFGFSTSALHHHLRAAERKLFETTFENKSPKRGDGVSHDSDG